MKIYSKLTLGIVLATSATLATIAHAQTTQPTTEPSTQPATQPAEPLDIEKVNTVIEGVVKEVTTGDDMITAFSMKVDEDSDIDEANIGLKLKTTLNTSVWAPNKDVKINASATTEKKVEFGSTTGIEATLAGSVRTEVMSMVKYFAKAYVEKNKDTTYASDFDKKILAIAEQLQNGADLGAVYQAGVDLKAALLSDQDSKEDQKYGDAMEITRTGNTQARIAIVKEIVLYDEFVTLKSAALTFKDGDFSLNVKVDFTVKNSDLADYIAQLKAALLSVQNQEPQTLSDIKSSAKNYLEALKDYVRGKSI